MVQNVYTLSVSFDVIQKQEEDNNGMMASDGLVCLSHEELDPLGRKELCPSKLSPKSPPMSSNANILSEYSPSIFRRLCSPRIEPKLHRDWVCSARANWALLQCNPVFHACTFLVVVAFKTECHPALYSCPVLHQRLVKMYLWQARLSTANVLLRKHFCADFVCLLVSCIISKVCLTNTENKHSLNLESKVSWKGHLQFFKFLKYLHVLLQCCSAANKILTKRTELSRTP